jgi:hypothetical protein
MTDLPKGYDEWRNAVEVAAAIRALKGASHD